MTPLLNVQELHVSYTPRTGQRFMALSGVSFALAAGEILGVLGESGSGKSTLAAALLRMLPTNGRVVKGAALFEGRDLLRAEMRDVERIRGNRIPLIFQEPSQALHPAIRVGEQVSDVIAAHKDLPRRAVREKAREVLATVFPGETERIANSYPHQLSGGQRARVLIAQAISCGPSLIIADEPTASLDPEMQQEILTVFRDLRQKLQLALIWITHYPALLAGFADRVMLSYAGKIVEIGPTERVLNSPHHPYTRSLLRSAPPSIENGKSSRKEFLPMISGEPPGSILPGGKCSFEPRCDDRMHLCAQREPAMVRLSNAHEVSCFKHGG